MESFLSVFQSTAYDQPSSQDFYHPTRGRANQSTSAVNDWLSICVIPLNFHCFTSTDEMWHSWSIKAARKTWKDVKRNFEKNNDTVSRSFHCNSIRQYVVKPQVRWSKWPDPIAYSLTVTLLIVSITKFSLVIGSARAYFLRNCSAIAWVSNYPFWTFCNWIAVIGQVCCPRVNHMHWIGFK